MDIHSVSNVELRGKTISLVRDFTDAPGGRTRMQGAFSGEEFREKLIAPALSEFNVVTVDLNGALGLPSSFLDESLGRYGSEVAAGKLVIRLSDNKVAFEILKDCWKKHVPA